MTEAEINAIMAEAQALINSLDKPGLTVASKTPKDKIKKIASIKKKKKPTILKGLNFHYDPTTYKALHKVANWHYVTDVQHLVDYLAGRIEGQPKATILAFDTETHSLGCDADKLPHHIVRRYVKKKAQDVPFGISISDGIDSWYLETDFILLKELVEDASVDKVLHNAKFDYHELLNLGMKLAGKIWDTLVMLKLIDENMDSYALKDLANKLIDKESSKWEIMKDNWLRSNNCKDWTKVPKELMGDYGAGDTWYTMCLLVMFKHYLKDNELEDLYKTESNLIYALARMERRGFMVNKPYLEGLRDVFTAEIAAAQNALYEKVGYIFNANSSQQLHKMFLKMGMPPEAIQINPETGNPILDAYAMADLAKEYPIANEILAVRKAEKLLSTYVEGVLPTLDWEDRVHGNWNQTEATTGRMSATNPNLQNLPKKDTRIRKAYIARPGYTLFFLDYDQVEYRLFAHYAQAKGLIDAIKAGKDVHTATAALIFNVRYEDVTSEQRSKAKTMNFALVYGQGDAHTAKSLGVDINEARKFKRGYFSDIPEAKPFLSTVMEVIKTRGFVKNIYGRRRHLIKDKAYKGPNALIQGCAADFAKEKIVKVDEYLQTTIDSGYVNFVHDEGIFEILNEEIATVVPRIKELMEEHVRFRVPITCDVEFSLTNWGEKCAYDLSKSFEENKKIFVDKYGEVA